MTSLCITVDPTDQKDIDDARNLLDQLRHLAVSRSSKEPEAPAVSRSEDPAAALAEELWKRLGKNIRLLTVAAVTFDDEFTLVDLGERLQAVADTLGEELHKKPTLTRIKGMWNGILLPTAGRARATIPGAPPFKHDAYNDDHLWHFTIDPDVRDAIRKQPMFTAYLTGPSEPTDAERQS